MFSNFFFIYFPVAEVQLSVFVVLLIGFVSGILAGLLGIGGGFISTPLLTLIGVPPSVAVATSAHQIVGTSFSGILPRIKPKKVDFKLGFILAISGLFGSYIGAYVFSFFSDNGNIDSIISLMYLILMTIISLLNFKFYFFKKKQDKEFKTKLNILMTYFPTSQVHCSALIPICFGILTGFLVVMMGVGGGFILVPMMIFLMRINNDIAIGTSLLQILLITIVIVLFHIFKTEMLDLLLGTFLILGSAFGSQISSILSFKIAKKKITYLLLAILTLLVACNFGFKLFFTSKSSILIQEYYDK